MKQINLFLVVCFFLIPQISNAGLFKINNKSGDAAAVYAMGELENEVNNYLPDADHSDYLKSIGNANIMAGKGLGADYTNLRYFVVGYGLGLGLDIGDNEITKVIKGDVDYTQIKGFSAQTAVMAGINWRGTKFFGHIMSMSLPKFNGITGKIRSIGFHIQTSVLNPTQMPGKILLGGFDLTVGLEYSSLNFAFTKLLNYSKTDQLGTTTATFAGQGVIGADVKTYSIPIEITSSVSIANFLYLYPGLGLDVNKGRTKSNAVLSGDVTVSGLASGTGDAVLDLGQQESPSAIMGRIFLGAQLNLVIVRIFAQVQKSVTETNLWSASTGIRIGL